MNERDAKLSLGRLESLFDAYGGDLGRWPDGLSAEARVLIAQSDAARRLQQEALALDRLLANASGPSPARMSLLAERIVVTAVAERGQSPAPADDRETTAAGARIIKMPTARRAAVTPQGRASTAPVGADTGRRWGRGSWRAASALAASLIFGFMIGFTDFAPTTAAYTTVASLVERVAGDTDVPFSALQLDPLNGLDEDSI